VGGGRDQRHDQPDGGRGDHQGLDRRQLQDGDGRHRWAPDPDSEVGRFYSKTTSGKVPGIADAELDALIERGARGDERGAARGDLQADRAARPRPGLHHRALHYPLRWELTWDFVKGYEVMPSNARLTVRKTYLDQ
jgi:peptide/nickel transport system substrate-binding protein